MITTERFNTLLQDQEASGYLTPIDSERDLSEIRGGGTGYEVGVKGSLNLETGKIEGSVYAKFTKDGTSVSATLKQNDMKEWILEYEAKKAKEQPKKEEPKPNPAPPSPAPKLMIDDSMMFALWT